jgi:hypothetical protein
MSVSFGECLALLVGAAARGSGMLVAAAPFVNTVFAGQAAAGMMK